MLLIQVLAEGLPMMAVCDLAGSVRLSSYSLDPLVKSKYIRFINLDRCSKLDNDGIVKLAQLHETLEGISLVGLKDITDSALLPVAMKCKALDYVNINYCSRISDVTIEAFAKNCRQLATFHVSSTMLSDECLDNLAGLLSAKHLTSLDVSFCRDATDNSMGMLAIILISYFNIMCHISVNKFIYLLFIFQ
jgi:hypothetical protein